MERFATEVYRSQLPAFPEKEFAEKLLAASSNEQQHVEYLHTRIAELRITPSRTGFLFQVAGAILGFKTRLIGQKFVLKTDTWIEKRAVKDYSTFLQKVDFDKNTIDLIRKIIDDEMRHIETWESSLEKLKAKLP